MPHFFIAGLNAKPLVGGTIWRWRGRKAPQKSLHLPDGGNFVIARRRKLRQPIAKNDCSSKKVDLLWANLVRGCFILAAISHVRCFASTDTQYFDVTKQHFLVFTLAPTGTIFSQWCFDTAKIQQLKKTAIESMTVFFFSTLAVGAGIHTSGGKD